MSMIDLYLKQTTPDNLEFVIDAERHEANKPFVGQWSHAQHVEALQNPDVGHFLIQHKQDSKAVGYLILAGLTNANESIELMRLVVVNKGKGYGKQALQLVKQFAFEVCQAHRLWLDVRDNNPRAQHVYVREGFQVEGRLRECVKVNNEFASLILLSILRSEYQTSK